MRKCFWLSGVWPWGDEGRGIVALSMRAPSKGGLGGGSGCWALGGSFAYERQLSSQLFAISRN